ncbi:hypothetical protein HPB51_023868 [Rhipicephalus microplus]|uniref:Uncharacterized protein n=1 Tax=Rhipicephalus microplus TaxID=6941 RepID=A0A9J6F971_RHIMP|nr:hypothetical protein HPB51_023868 [Rhipicephalus microplus]
MEVSSIHRRPSLQRQSSIRLWDLGWGLWGAFKFVLASLLAGSAAARPSSERAARHAFLADVFARESSRRRRGGPPRAAPKHPKYAVAARGLRGWRCWPVLACGSGAATGFAWLLIARWTSLINLTLRWTSAFLAVLKEADAKSTRQELLPLQFNVQSSLQSKTGVSGVRPFVCRDCATYDSRDRGWYCRLCEQQRIVRQELEAMAPASYQPPMQDNWATVSLIQAVVRQEFANLGVQVPQPARLMPQPMSTPVRNADHHSAPLVAAAASTPRFPPRY